MLILKYLWGISCAVGGRSIVDLRRGSLSRSPDGEMSSELHPCQETHTECCCNSDQISGVKVFVFLVKKAELELLEVSDSLHFFQTKV